MAHRNRCGPGLVVAPIYPSRLRFSRPRRDELSGGADPRSRCWPRMSVIRPGTLAKGEHHGHSRTARTELPSARNVVTDVVQKAPLVICVIGGGSLALTHVAHQSAHFDREFEPGKRCRWRAHHSQGIASALVARNVDRFGPTPDRAVARCKLTKSCKAYSTAGDSAICGMR